MRNKLVLLFLFTIGILPIKSIAQPNEGELGAWYMYFFNTSFKENVWGVQGDVQYRNWNTLGDLEQLLLRGGITYKPQSANVKFTLGYANITTGKYGEDNSTSSESRIYQEALLPMKVGERFYFTHRFRYEQRFVENQDFRTRYRYNLFLNIPLNNQELSQNTFYVALYNELFINGQRGIGNGMEVAYFDRNRLYAAIGYAIQNNLRVQAGIMNQTTDNWHKNQLQVSLHHSF